MEDKDKKEGTENFVIEVNAESNVTEKDPVIEASEEAQKETIVNVINSEEPLTAEEVEFIKENIDGPVNAAVVEDEQSLGDAARKILGNFMSFIQGEDFDEKCEEKATKYGLSSSIVKNAFIRNVLGSIANALNMTVHIAGDIVKGAVGFIATIIDNVVNFGVSVLHKLVTVATLNCGSVQY